jgi:hypothetical protein
VKLFRALKFAEDKQAKLIELNSETAKLNIECKLTIDELQRMQQQQHQQQTTTTTTTTHQTKAQGENNNSDNQEEA